jgi:hypothetical protein
MYLLTCLLYRQMQGTHPRDHRGGMHCRVGGPDLLRYDASVRLSPDVVHAVFFQHLFFLVDNKIISLPIKRKEKKTW